MYDNDLEIEADQQSQSSFRFYIVIVRCIFANMKRCDKAKCQLPVLAQCFQYTLSASKLRVANIMFFQEVFKI